MRNKIWYVLALLIVGSAYVYLVTMPKPTDAEGRAPTPPSEPVAYAEVALAPSGSQEHYAIAATFVVGAALDGITAADVRRAVQHPSLREPYFPEWLRSPAALEMPPDHNLIGLGAYENAIVVDLTRLSALGLSGEAFDTQYEHTSREVCGYVHPEFCHDCTVEDAQRYARTCETNVMRDPNTRAAMAEVSTCVHELMGANKALILPLADDLSRLPPNDFPAFRETLAAAIERTPPVRPETLPEWCAF